MVPPIIMLLVKYDVVNGLVTCYQSSNYIWLVLGLDYCVAISEGGCLWGDITALGHRGHKGHKGRVGGMDMDGMWTKNLCVNLTNQTLPKI